MNETVRSDYQTELEKNNSIAFVPGGNSMWPILKHKGQSVIVCRKTEKLKKFDVAFYKRKSGAFVLHRVMEITDDGYVMCGDSQFFLENVKEEQVFGIMIGFYRGKKYVDVNDPKYVKEIENWYGRKLRRKIRLKLFRIRQKIKRLFKR
jgi:hypothetical protein